jgi:hypothetical protein
MTGMTVTVVDTLFEGSPLLVPVIVTCPDAVGAVQFPLASITPAVQVQVTPEFAAFETVVENVTLLDVDTVGESGEIGVIATTFGVTNTDASTISPSGPVTRSQ